MIALAVSMANCCLSCLVAHGAAFIEASAAMIQRDPVGQDRVAQGLAQRAAILDFGRGTRPG
jgi:hypothetical protein